jgi:hypothetical protein
MKIFKTKEIARGVYSCDIDVTAAEWKKILEDSITAPYKKVLLAFYTEPEHKGTCSQIGLKYFSASVTVQKVTSLITQFGRIVLKHLNRFSIQQAHSEQPSYWNVAMNPGTTLPSGEFEWTLRPELVQAMEELGWTKRFSWVPFFMELADKLLPYKDNRTALIDIVYSLDEKYTNYLQGTADGVRISDIDPFSVFALFNRGWTDDNRALITPTLKDKLHIAAAIPSDYAGVSVLNSQQSVFFSKETVKTNVQPLWDFFVAALSGNQEALRRSFDIVRQQHGIKWNISMALYWIRPNDYIALDAQNRAYLPKLGIEVFDETQLDAAHYFQLLDMVQSKIKSRQIGENSIPEISYNAWINNGDRKIWLVGYTFNASESQFERFLKENIWQGIFMDESKSDQHLLKLAKTIKAGDVIVLKSTGTKGTKHDQSFLRVKAIGIVQGDIESNKIPDATSCLFPVMYISTVQTDFDGSSYGSFRKTIHLLDAKQTALIDYIDAIINNKTMSPVSSKYKEYIELLQANKNVVLTGAPGTGKTYMAKAIAVEMNAVTKFVQFHPSYDYTDFVEGLRPVENENGQIGFERKDGVFKEFCREAIKNLEDSKKSVEALGKEQSWQERLQQFAEDAIDTGISLTTSNKSNFTIRKIDERYITVYNERNEKTPEIPVNVDEILTLLLEEVPLSNVRDIKRYFGRKYGTQPDSYAFAIVQKLRKQPIQKLLLEAPVKKVERKNYVFIIDEINRGEASKIFGELFYAIDPGYRGDKTVCVQTQYQNLVPETDVFAKGFYVPENVYILATMNDIDRSVESMDFAMRRRFTWIEVSPSDTDGMLDILGSDLADVAKSKMNQLNQAIADADGLGRAYMIGPSYFLKLKDYNGDFSKLWRLNIEPLLKEYLRGFRKPTELMKKFESAYIQGDTQTPSETIVDAHEN